MTDDPFSAIEPSCFPGPRHRDYPLRDVALDAIRGLGILAVKREIPDAHDEMTTTVIDVDRPSLLAHLASWLRSDDSSERQAAIDVASRLPGEDIRAVVDMAQRTDIAAFD